MTTTHSTSLWVQFRAGDDRITGRVRDQEGNDWPFSSWLDLLTLIERLRTGSTMAGGSDERR